MILTSYLLDIHLEIQKKVCEIVPKLYYVGVGVVFDVLLLNKLLERGSGGRHQCQMFIQVTIHSYCLSKTI